MKNKQISKITHKGLWNIDKENNISIECYVTNDQRRFLSLRGTARTLGLKGAGSTAISRNLKSKWIQPYLSEKLTKWLSDVKTSDIEKISGKSSNITPLEADLFVDICKAYVNAQRDSLFNDNRNNVLPQWKKQDLIANKLYIIMSAFAKIGIIALIDEITGFQEDRSKEELQRLLRFYISEELLPWTRRFPNEFYKHMFRLWGWNYPLLSKGAPKGPRYAGKLTKELIYDKLPQGVIDKLENKNPPNKKWQRKYKHHQWLTIDIGNPHLEKQVAVVTTLMKISANKREFKRNFARAFPIGPQQQQIPGFEDE